MIAKKILRELETRELNEENDFFTKLYHPAKGTEFFHVFNQIIKYGRTYELGLMIKYLMFNHPVHLLKQIPHGLRMIIIVR